MASTCHEGTGWQPLRCRQSQILLIVLANDGGDKGWCLETARTDLLGGVETSSIQGGSTSDLVQIVAMAHTECVEGAGMPEATDKPSETKEREAGSSSKVSVGGLVLALVTAILTGAVSYAYGVANDIRKAKLDFVNAQIEKLYGPLYAASQSSDEVWKLFRDHQWRNRDAQDESSVFFDDKHPPTVDQVRRWRHWMQTVFQPLNLKMEGAIVTNSHLLIGDTVPLVFRTLIAHTEAYKAVIAAWHPDDFAKCEQSALHTQVGPPCPAVTVLENTVGINFPRAIGQCVAEDYPKLKRRQQELESGFIIAFFTRSVERSPTCG